jgi:signal transduction histidine kinase
MATRKSKIKCLLISSLKGMDFFQPILFDSLGQINTEIQLELYTQAVRNSVVHNRLRSKDFVGNMSSSDLILVDLENISQSLFFEIGVARAVGKPIVFMAHEKSFFIDDLPDFIRQSYFILFEKKEELQNSLKHFFIEFLENPRRFTPSPMIEPDTSSQITVDLEKLDPREFENLCFELLSRLGYKQLEWKIKDDFIDAVSTLQKKDPDGFEYDEYWLISFEKGDKSKEFFDIVLHDPEYLAERVFRYIFEPGMMRSDRFVRERIDIPVTLLIILQDKDNFPKRFIKDLSRRDYRIKGRSVPFTMRIRWWDEQFITSLVQNNLQLARKYFSSEALAKSNIRLSYEELYKQNIGMYEELQKTNEALVSERNRVELLERDAAWKLLSFTAAHRLGNPIDVIDSELQNLKFAIDQNNKNMVDEIASNMEQSVEKAKSIVSQFRNLSIAHEIKPEVVKSGKLNEIIQHSAKQAIDKKIKVSFDIKNHPDVSVDTQKLSECFEELVKNALHFVKGDHPLISISTMLLKKTELPDKIDRTKEYIKITFSDNGCGVPVEKKNEIFKPFERSYIHGTGLGLAFCEIIIEKHGGKIREVGKPNEGATFEIFLPIIPTKELKK